jgi:hypothetical protein
MSRLSIEFSNSIKRSAAEGKAEQSSLSRGALDAGKPWTPLAPEAIPNDGGKQLSHPFSQAYRPMS